ncbi:hypothetical protein L596_016764 [Steinernema carpocapsae]|uniref:Uncharacterized protein n=1 Tax=Steinernema carpocapsae TaxID=34508 RepID=A0A4U5NJZ6_STECR|nr:hypothetical protein L596_016764 [Steinernema carpocapsae]
MFCLSEHLCCGKPRPSGESGFSHRYLPVLQLRSRAIKYGRMMGGKLEGDGRPNANMVKDEKVTKDKEVSKQEYGATNSFRKAQLVYAALVIVCLLSSGAGVEGAITVEECESRFGINGSWRILKTLTFRHHVEILHYRHHDR